MLTLQKRGSAYCITCSEPDMFEFYNVSNILIGTTTKKTHWAFWSEVHRGWLVRKEDREIAADYVEFHNKRILEEKREMRRLTWLAEEMNL